MAWLACSIIGVEVLLWVKYGWFTLFVHPTPEPVIWGWIIGNGQGCYSFFSSYLGVIIVFGGPAIYFPLKNRQRCRVKRKAN